MRRLAVIALVCLTIVAVSTAATSTNDGVGQVRYVLSPVYVGGPGGRETTVAAKCPKGWVVLGGGYRAGNHDVAIEARPVPPRRYVVTVQNRYRGTDPTQKDASALVYASCGKGYTQGYEDSAP